MTPKQNPNLPNARNEPTLLIDMWHLDGDDHDDSDNADAADIADETDYDDDQHGDDTHRDEGDQQ